jgi:hypothetical protein
LKILRGFLGLEGYYHKFVKDYGQIASPIIMLLKNKAFSWTQEVTKDFEKLKEAMCTTLVMATPDFTKTFIVECNATWHGMFSILMQEGRALAFESIQLK